MKTISIILIGITIFAISCKDPFNKSIKGNGNILTENRSVTDFSEIKSTGKFNVYITQDSVYSIVVEAEENLLPYISTEITGNKLILKTSDNKNLRNTEPINIYLSAKIISHVALSGSGYIDIQNINTSNIKVDISGSGDINCNAISNTLNAHISGSGELMLSGTSVNSSFDISGSGKIRSYNLQQENCEINITGSGDTYVSVVNSLDVRISGSGSVHYVGSPSINTNITGSGSIINNN